MPVFEAIDKTENLNAYYHVLEKQKNEAILNKLRAKIKKVKEFINDSDAIILSSEALNHDYVSPDSLDSLVVIS